MRFLRVGVIGTGYWGPNIIRNLADMRDTTLHAVCDRIPDRLHLVRKRYPSAKIFTDHRVMLKDPTLDAVAIATPVSTHYAIARDALEAGKHVFVEKPLTDKSATARALATLAKKKRRTLMVDHVFLYSAPVRKIKDLVRSGHLGEIYYFDSVRVNLGLFQKDVNVIWDLAVHDLAIMDHVIGPKPKSVSAIAVSHIKGSGKEDLAYITIRYPGQLLAHIHVNWLAPAKIRQILIGGAKRMVVYDDTNPSEKIKIFDKGVSPVNKAHRQVDYRLGDMWAPNLDMSEALRRALGHFVDCIRTGRKPLTDGDAGIRIVRLLESADRSARLRGREIPL
jgi:predicted dehydrogenase